jgi:hypothetical protein
MVTVSGVPVISPVPETEIPGLGVSVMAAPVLHCARRWFDERIFACREGDINENLVSPADR